MILETEFWVMSFLKQHTKLCGKHLRNLGELLLTGQVEIQSVLIASVIHCFLYRAYGVYTELNTIDGNRKAECIREGLKIL